MQSKKKKKGPQKLALYTLFNINRFFRAYLSKTS